MSNIPEETPKLLYTDAGACYKDATGVCQPSTDPSSLLYTANGERG